MQLINVLKCTGFGAAILASCYLPAVVHGQVQSGTNSQTPITKPTTEPVFRVSRLAKANPSLDSNAVAPTPAVAASPAVAPKPAVNTRVDNDMAMVPAVHQPYPPSDANIAFDSKSAVPEAPKAAAHPLDQALTFAHQSLNSIRANVYDYTARLAKRESINGQVGKTSFMDVKIRCPRVTAQGQQTPFSIYMKFLQPRDASGREVLWVDGRDNNNLLAHQPGGLIGLRTFELDPTGMMAMQGQRYPIFEAGLENLVAKLIEKATRDRAAGMCEVSYRDGLALNKRPCSLIEVVHHEKRAPYEFHKAQVLIDNELNVPVRYTSYDWPKSPGAKPQILEQYTYINIKMNVGLTDEDFNPKNPAYNFPGR